MVIHPAEVRKALVAATKKAGGYPMLVSDASVKLKMPPAQLSALMDKAASSGIVLDKSLQRQDLTARIAQLEGRLRSKREIFAQLRDFIDDSDVQATLMIEQTMTRLVAELETVKGELRVARDRARWAVLDVSFRFQKRGRIVYKHSPFKWINTVDLHRFFRRF